MAILLLWTRIY